MDNQRHKVVLVDDNAASLDQGKSLLQAHFSVMTFQSAALLFEYLEHDLPDLILLDVEMPEMDGFEAIEKLKTNPKYEHIPVIFLTASSDEESERKGFRLGAVDYIAKPFSAPLLQKRISNQILYMRVQDAVKDYSENLEAMVDEVAKANERATVLMDKMPFSCRLVDRFNHIVYCNDAAVKLFGFKDKQDCLNNPTNIYPEFQPNGELSMKKSEALFNQAFNEGTVVYDWLYQLPDGTLIPAEVTLVKIEYENTNAIAVFTRDLREREAAIIEKRRAEIAEMTSLAKSQFLAMMSHELRTPMNSITGFAELALDMPEGSVPPEVKDYLKKIQDSTRWFLRIANDILDISRIESGKMEIEHIPFNLQDVFSRCQSVIMPEALEKGLDYHVYLEPLTGVKLIGDPMRLYQALINLLINAVKFTHVGIVNLSALPKEQSDNHVSIYFEVKDTGIGMEADQIKKVFEPFTQADSSTTRLYGGSGLGLSITKNIIELMGGTLSVQSAVGKGSTFSFVINFETMKVSADTPAVVKEESIEKPVFEGEILVCDDNELNQEVICEHLARVGLKTIVAANGNESVKIVRERASKGEPPFDLIFMDIYMPVMDGIEAASQIIAMGTKTPIVAMTANIMTSEVKKYREHGMPDCLSKPFTAKELWKILLKYLAPVNSVPI